MVIVLAGCVSNKPKHDVWFRDDVKRYVSDSDVREIQSILNKSAKYANIVSVGFPSSFGEEDKIKCIISSDRICIINVYVGTECSNTYCHSGPFYEFAYYEGGWYIKPDGHWHSR